MTTCNVFTQWYFVYFNSNWGGPYQDELVFDTLDVDLVIVCVCSGF